MTLRPPASPPRPISKTQANHIKYRLRELGYRSYKQYLGSEHWEELKEQYRRSRLPQKCLVCFSPNVDLHHKSYRRLGAERTEDLVPLCRDHHDELHDRGLDFWTGPRRLLGERRARLAPVVQR